MSSPIREFADLRDALKFWLEEMGYLVQMSEHNDFKRKPEAGTFEACFQSIRQADYFVLLIGRTRGSWYSRRSGVSVTRQEYRTAYDSLVKDGKPKVLAFVRHEVLTILEEREEGQAAAGTKSILSDPTFTSDFVREARREAETNNAVSGRGAYPAGNWLTEFGTFRELTDGLRSCLRIREPLARNAILENLRHELAHNLRLTMVNFKGNPFYHHLWLTKVRRDIQLKTEHTHPEVRIPLSFDQVKELVEYSLLGPTASEAFARSALDDAISSRGLLDYDIEQDRYVASPLLTVLYRLREELGVYGTRYKSAQDYQPELMNLWDSVRPGKHGASIPGFRLALLFGLYDNEQNIVRLLVGILRYLYGHAQTIDVMYRPMSPIVGMDERIRAEVVSEKQMDIWLKADIPLLRIGTIDMTEDQRRAMNEQLDAIGQVLREDQADGSGCANKKEEQPEG